MHVQINDYAVTTPNSELFLVWFTICLTLPLPNN
jgi:hypothetical protein